MATSKPETVNAAKPVTAPSKKVKRTFKLSVRVDRAEKEFSPGMGAGVLATVEVSFNLTPEKYASPIFALSLREQAERLRDEVIKLDFVEVDAPAKAPKTAKPTARKTAAKSGK